MFIDEVVFRAFGHAGSHSFSSETRSAFTKLNAASTKNHNAFPDDAIPMLRAQLHVLPSSSACRLNTSIKWLRLLEIAEGATH
jgi:DNA-binding transcriptional regulator YiaG